MRIYSSFHDYYDIALQYGIDPNCIYKREEVILNYDDLNYKLINEFIEKKLIEHDLKYFPNYTYTNYSYNIEYVFFCGKVYLNFLSTVHFIEKNKDMSISFDNFKDFYTFLKNKNLIKNKYKESIIKKIEKYNSIFPYGNDEIIELHLKCKSPIILMRLVNLREKYKITLNPCLKNLKFFKHVDAVNTFQELSQFISGIMGGQVPPMIEISDTIRLEKKGFDKIHSFRNTKEGRTYQ